MEEVNKNVSHPSHYNQGIEAIKVYTDGDPEVIVEIKN